MGFNLRGFFVASGVAEFEDSGTNIPSISKKDRNVNKTFELKESLWKSANLRMPSFNIWKQNFDLSV
jgi:hypothetical protein